MPKLENDTVFYVCFYFVVFCKNNEQKIPVIEELIFLNCIITLKGFSNFYNQFDNAEIITKQKLKNDLNAFKNAGKYICSLNYTEVFKDFFLFIRNIFSKRIHGVNFFVKFIY